MWFKVAGTEKETGRTVELVVDAPDEGAARAEAARRGMRVERIAEIDDESKQRESAVPRGDGLPREPVLVRIEPGHVQLIELTAKRWKALTAIGLVLFLGGAALCLWIAAADPRVITRPTAMLLLGGAATAAGIVILIVGRLGAWWHHR